VAEPVGQDRLVTTIGALLVDDYSEIRLLMRMIINATNAGLKVVGEASSGEEALAMIDECDPAVVVLDQMMPGMSGLETAQRIREMRPKQAMVFCSAYLDDELTERARSVGFSEIIPKDQIPRLPEALRRAYAAA
jgi:CheY-like chemotaxis protein